MLRYQIISNLIRLGIVAAHACAVRLMMMPSDPNCVAPQEKRASKTATMPEVPTAREQPELPFASSGNWGALPTSKIRRPRGDAPFAWAYTYTAFSLDFAAIALERLGADRKSNIVDPFLGSGTTMLASAMRGCTSLGVDISPFSTLLSRARIANCANRKLARMYLDCRPGRALSASSQDTLEPVDVAYATAVIERICDNRGLAPSVVLSTLLSDEIGRYDSEVIALVSLAIGARQCAKLERGSNPIWYRRHSDRRDGPRTTLRTVARRWGTIITDDLAQSPPLRRPGQTILNQDFRTFDRLGPQFDICLTSPPYPNRLDYVVAHLPELSVLRLVSPLDLEGLRRNMIGTTKIINKEIGDAPAEWGETCRLALRSIGEHPSYASERYYYYTYYQYFRMLYDSFVRIKAIMARPCQGLIVLQTSFYKDVRIATPEICTEMLRSLSLNASVVRTTPVRQHMGKMSPIQASYVPQKILGESLVHFSQ